MKPKILTASRQAVEATLPESSHGDSKSLLHPDLALSKVIQAPVSNRNLNLTSGDQVRWAEAFKRAVRSGSELMQILGLPPENACSAAEVDFPVFVPWEYISRIQPGRLDDPLLQQVMSVQQEITPVGSGLLDPVEDRAFQISPGLLKKYDGRALMIVSGACAVHCRYCFRRHFPYAEAPSNPSGWRQALQSIASDPSLCEVILSGGDPLSVRDELLSSLVDSLNAISHIKRIRIHTRFPVMIPQRVCQPLLDWVASSRCAIYFVLHFNHAREIDDKVVQALNELRKAGATLLNQSVLLKGVNDSAISQIELCQRLIDLHVLPYYLHQLDEVQGGMHFRVTDDIARQIIAAVRGALPGYAVPRLVREIPGRPSKTPL